ncbi:NUDIX hydrolase [Nannocystis sp.]|uniref:NUDIX hydrolase n=1 Tax=Nannocystis sp. TaxID=1962667 RepID=UPI0025ED16FF|nr:NUDIX hydrolase [Nannocystis sp.]MBK7829409.1 NUDIX hydrolase [Nannocystis sp.]
MSDLKFVPQREVWFVSAFVNAAEVDPHARAGELAATLEAEIRGVTRERLAALAWDPGLQGACVAMLGAWRSAGAGAPSSTASRTTTSTGLVYDKLGHFDWWSTCGDPEQAARRRAIEPVLVQQAPLIAAERLRRLASLKVSSALRLDTNSPIFVMVICDEVLPAAPAWTRENVQLHRRALGAWTEVYSGAWPDYSDELYAQRVAGNLSNRLSELHLLRKNSGFLYLAPDNMRRFMDSYMRPYVLLPTAQLRAMHFAMFSINESLDVLLMRQARDDFFDLVAIEDKLRDLRQIRGALQMKMSEIYNELDSNRRQHYSAVLRHLLGEFNLERGGIVARIGEKFDTLHDGLQHLYQRRSADDQARADRRLGTLGTLFSLGVLADFASLLLGTADSVSEGRRLAALINGGFSAVLLVVLVWAIAGRIRLRIESSPPRPLQAAAAIVLDGQGRVLVITRKNPPFRGQRAFPGTFVASGASAAAALLREVKDETDLDVVVERLVGRYARADRDPRGRVVAEAYLCRVTRDGQAPRSREDAGEARFVAIAELRGEDLAFDHEDMLVDAERLLAG